jgi:hypothetical protein
MPTPNESLVAAGSPRVFTKAIEKSLRRHAKLPAMQEDVRSRFDVDGCDSINSFKQTAKKILSCDASQIGWLIEKARERFDESIAGAGNLFFTLNALEFNYSQGVKGSRFQRILDLSFRRAGAKVPPMAS